MSRAWKVQNLNFSDASRHLGFFLTARRPHTLWVNPCYHLAPPARHRGPGVPAALQLQFPQLPAYVRERAGLGGTLKPSSLHLPCWGLTSCPNSLLIVPFSGSHQSAAGRWEAVEGTGGSTMHSCLHTAQIPRASDVTCISLPEAGTGWEGLSHARLCSQLTSAGAR